MKKLEKMENFKKMKKLEKNPFYLEISLSRSAKSSYSLVFSAELGYFVCNSPCSRTKISSYQDHSRFYSEYSQFVPTLFPNNKSSILKNPSKTLKNLSKTL